MHRLLSSESITVSSSKQSSTDEAGKLFICDPLLFDELEAASRLSRLQEESSMWL
ncbi:uncharacterized protein V6R79_008020 [Siganus canaliculatus]